MIPIRVLQTRDEIEQNSAVILGFLRLDSSVFLPYHSVYDIYDQIERRVLQVWLIGDIGMVLTRTELYQRGAYKVLRVMYAFGHTDNLPGVVKYVMEVLEEVARTNGTHQIRVEGGRPGWRRLLKGYNLEQTVVSKKL